MRKLILLCLITLLVYVFPVNATSGDSRIVRHNNNDFDIAATVLREIDVIDEIPNETALDNNITRYEFAMNLARLIKESSVLTNGRYFQDEDCAEINNLAAKGILRGDDERIFHADEEITEIEAVYILVRTLCLTDNFSRDTDYIRIARDLDLLDEINLYKPVTYEEMILMLYRVGLAEVDLKVYTPNDNIINFGGSKSIFTDYYDIHYISGQITENSYTTLYGAETVMLEENEVKINDTVFTSKTDAGKYIGQSIRGFYRQAKDTDNKKLLCFVEDTEINDKLTLRSEDMNSFSEFVLKYSDGDSGKEKVIRLSQNLAVIYNGKATTRTYERLFSSLKYGTITFCKTGDSDLYSVALIHEEKNVTVTAIDTEKYLIYTDGDDGNFVIDITPFSKGRYAKLWEDHEETAFGLTSTAKNDKLTVFASEDAYIVEAYRANENLTGVVESVKKKNVFMNSVRVDGKEYDCVNTVSLVPGNTYTMTLNKSGVIAWADTDLNQFQVGYLYNVKSEKSAFSDTVTVKIYTEGKKHLEAELSDKVRLNDEVKIASEVKNLMLNENKVERQLLMFKINDSGKIYQINMPPHQADDDNAPMSELTNGYENLYYVDSLMLFYPTYVYNTDTKVFIVPPEGTDNYSKENFNVTDMRNRRGPFGDNGRPKLRMYKLNNDLPYVSYIVYQVELKPIITDQSPMMIVENTSINYVGQDTVKTINGYMENIPMTVYVENNVDLSQISSGDVIAYQRDASGYIAELKLLYDYSEDKTSWGDTYQKTRYRLGTLEKIETDHASGDKIRVTVTYNGTEEEYIYMDKDMFNVTIYDSSARNEKLRVGDAGDVMPVAGSGNKYKIFVYSTEMQYNQIYVYK